MKELNNFRKFLTENINTPHPTEVFTEDELDYINEAIMNLHKKVNPSLDDDKTMALMAFIEASMTEMY